MHYINSRLTYLLNPYSTAVLYLLLITVPTVPRIIAVVSSDVTSVLLSWRPPRLANGIIRGYSIRYYTSRDDSELMLDDDVTVIAIDDHSSLRYNVTGLQPYTTYMLQVLTYLMFLYFLQVYASLVCFSALLCRLLIFDP